MNWYYLNNGQQVGPLPEADFRNLVASGVVTNQTLVWHEGLPEWKAYGAVASATTPSAGDVACAECGRVLPVTDAVQIGAAVVCADCKPIFLQKLQEGVATGASGRGTATLDEVLSRDYDVPIGEAARTGWELVKANLGIMIGATILVWLIVLACGIVPFVGGIAQLVLQGPLMGGLYLFYLAYLRGGRATVGDAFSGFRIGFANLMLTHIVSSLLAGVCFIPAGILFVISIVVQSGSRSFEFGGLLIAAIVLGIFGFIAMVYLQVSWIFALPLAADKQLGFWQAMQVSRKVVGKHWWGIFGLVFVTGLVVLLGVLVCGVGVLVAGPVAGLMLLHQYNRIFGDLRPQA
jgi:uncharacterized membrane protein